MDLIFDGFESKGGGGEGELGVQDDPGNHLDADRPSSASYGKAGRTASAFAPLFDERVEGFCCLKLKAGQEEHNVLVWTHLPLFESPHRQSSDGADPFLHPQACIRTRVTQS